MKAQSKRKKKLLVAAAALALIAASSGTFAWITSRDARINRVAASNLVKDTTKIVEDFKPAPLLPGTETVKEVEVENTGEAKVYVRVSYEEVFKHLVGRGAITYGNSKYTYVANDNGLGHDMPAPADVSGFTQVPDAQVTAGLPADCHVYVQGGVYKNPTTGAVNDTSEAMIVHEYTTGKFQIMNATITAAAKTEDTDAVTWNYTVSGEQYGVYAGGYEHTVINWAESAYPDEAGNDTGTSLLGTAGARYGVDYDYTKGALDITTVTPDPFLPTKSTDAAVIPTTQEVKGVQADGKAFTKNLIQIGYSNKLIPTTDIATATDNWVYNSEDGWFYYAQPLDAKAKTGKLLEKLIFHKDMGDEYKNASFDLVVKLEAIQATPEAMTDAQGWELDITNAGKPVTKAIYDKLAN